MGIIDSQEKLATLISKLTKIKGPLGFLAYLGGIFGMILLAKEDISPRTYFSENALLPGMVQTSYVNTRSAMNLYHEFDDIKNTRSYVQFRLIEQKMFDAGLDVHHQNFSVGNKANIAGNNIYGILASQRTPGVEAIVLHVPYQDNGLSSGGLGLMLSLAAYFRAQSYWAKNIIFLVTQHGPYGLKAWLSGYYGDALTGIQYSNLTGFAGAIQAALTLDMKTLAVNEVVIHIGGSNGLLPNLDLINLVFRVSGREGLYARLSTELHFAYSYDEVERLVVNARNLFTMMAEQASGFSSGYHGEYFRYRIEAVTLESTGSGNYNEGLLKMGRLVESVFRSLNSLLEHFHQSFFFYIMAIHSRYISIGLYMVPLGLMLLGPVLYAVCLWSETIAEGYYTTEKEKKRPCNPRNASAILTELLVPIVVHLFAYMAYDKLSQIRGLQILTVEYGVILCTCVSLTIRICRQHVSDVQWKIQRLIATIYLILVVTAVALVNFSLGFWIALFWVPLALVFRYQSSKLISAFNMILSTFLCPPLILVIMCLLYRLIALDENLDSFLFSHSLKQANQYLSYAMENQFLDVWTLKLCTVVLLPLWALLATL